MSKFSWNNLNKPVLILAPMANITTLPFRSICRKLGADIVFTPMISSNAIVHNTDETLKIAKYLAHEQPVIVQIFGYDGELLAKAANIINDHLKPAGVDINMGCPAPKITGNECGSSLLKDYDKALQIAKKVRDSFSGQLSIKVRLGWEKFDVLPFVQELEKIGINAVSVHGRTTKQGYTGLADWNAIEEIAENVNIPVIGNGDIKNKEEALNILKSTKLTGVMIGRASLGNPWVFSNHRPTVDEIADTILEHTDLSIEYDGEKRGVLEMRKHLAWYIKGFNGALKLRKEAVLVETKSDILNIVEKFRKIIPDN